MTHATVIVGLPLEAAPYFCTPLSVCSHRLRGKEAWSAKAAFKHVTVRPKSWLTAWVEQAGELTDDASPTPGDSLDV